MNTKTVGLLMMSLLVVASCGLDESEAGTVAVHGAVFTDFKVDITCEDYPTGSRPEEVSGVVLFFSDGTGALLGQAETGKLEWSQLDYGCRFFASYEDVVLPVAATYRVDFDPPPPKGSFWGAEELTAQQISFEELEGAGFRWDFEALPAFVVSDPPCAFDETACLAADLVLAVTPSSDPPAAVLTATAGVESNSWTRNGILGTSLEATTLDDLTDPFGFPTVAPRFELITLGEVDSVAIYAFDSARGDNGSQAGPVERFRLEVGQPEVLRLPAGAYILVVRLPHGAPVVGFSFGIRVP